MIVMDIPLPKCCEVCPCSHMVMHGEFEGRIMCAAMEFRDGILAAEDQMVDKYKGKRPEGCPIKKWF